MVVLGSWKDGKRCVDGFYIQKYVCANRECYHRFVAEHKHYKESETIRKRHVSVTLQGDSKNMAPRTEIKTVPGEENRHSTQLDVNGKLLEYSWYMQKQNFQPETRRTNIGSLRALIERNANLMNPESVKETLMNATVFNKDGSAGRAWSANRKRNVINAYTLFLKVNGLHWEKPKNNVIRKIPLIPTEQEIDQLIAGCPTQLATFLQVLKETAMRSGELIGLKWLDVDSERRIITLNDPEKGSLPRSWNKLSGKLWNMLNALPKQDVRVFGPSTIYSLKNTFYRSRLRLSNKIQNPRLLAIHFHSLRHWKATMIYHETKDLLHTMAFLGHKKSDNTLLYVQLDEKLFNDQDDQWTVKAVHSEQEAIELGEVGFEPYLTFNGVQLVRKRKTK